LHGWINMFESPLDCSKNIYELEKLLTSFLLALALSCAKAGEENRNRKFTEEIRRKKLWQQNQISFKAPCLF